MTPDDIKKLTEEYLTQWMYNSIQYGTETAIDVKPTVDPKSPEFVSELICYSVWNETIGHVLQAMKSNDASNWITIIENMKIDSPVKLDNNTKH